MIYWNLEQHSQSVVLSNKPLTRENYLFQGMSAIYDANGNYQIRPPEHASDEILERFEPGTELFYLAYEDAIRSEKDIRSVFLLTRDEVIELLPETAGAGDSELKQRILNTPGFLPS